MEDGIEELGEWWLPESPDRIMAGKVTFTSSNGPALSLIGSFAEDADVGEAYPVVFGRAARLGDVTLTGCWQATYFPFGRQIYRTRAATEYRARTAYVGAHLPAKELSFREISIRTNNLVDWVNFRGFSYSDLSKLA